jgi:hypothetical protein
MPGVGKTWLALYWAHRVVSQFPDGQLFVDMRGYDNVEEMLTPLEVLKGFTASLGVPLDRIPSDLDALVGLYRSLLADKRLLVVLDNAREAEHIRPLLPGSSHCAVVVTSRSDLMPLVVTNGARALSLRRLTVEGGHDLLASQLGEDFLASDPEATRVIIESCGGLPLALAIVASRLAGQSEAGLGEAASELLTARSTLDFFDGGDLATDLRAVFARSYRSLSEAAAALFRVLGEHPADGVSLTNLAADVCLPPDIVRLRLAELVRANIVQAHQGALYSIPTLLRQYAAELSIGVSPGDRQRRLSAWRPTA